MGSAKALTVPTLGLAGRWRPCVLYKTTAILQNKLLQNSTLKIDDCYSHGMHTVNADVINEDLLAFIRG
jgi:non-heme chloroperoxidase